MGLERSRNEARSTFELDVRIALLESDADDREADVRAIRRSISQMTGALAMAAITFGTMTIAAALNLIIH